MKNIETIQELKNVYGYDAAETEECVDVFNYEDKMLVILTGGCSAAILPWDWTKIPQDKRRHYELSLSLKVSTDALLKSVPEKSVVLTLADLIGWSEKITPIDERKEKFFDIQFCHNGKYDRFLIHRSLRLLLAREFPATSLIKISSVKVSCPPFASTYFLKFEADDVTIMVMCVRPDLKVNEDPMPVI